MSAWESATGATDEWYTPKYIFDALRCEFDLDVAAPEFGPLYVPAKEWLPHSGLETAWHGFVWMNPPFGGRNGIRPWLDKFFRHGNGIALTPDRTSAPWFQVFWPLAAAVMFLPKVKFIRPDGTLGKQPGTGTALWAVGNRAASALECANNRGLGILARPEPSLGLARVA